MSAEYVSNVISRIKKTEQLVARRNQNSPTEKTVLLTASGRSLLSSTGERAIRAHGQMGRLMTASNIGCNLEGR